MVQSQKQLDNLKNGVKTQFNSETAAIAGRKGALSPKRKDKKTMGELLKMGFESPLPDMQVKELIRKGFDSLPPQWQSLVTVAIIKECVAGNERAWEFARDTMGEKPTERIELQRPIDESVAELDALLKKMDDDGKRNVSKADKK